MPPKADKKLDIVFVINGEDVKVFVNENEPLAAARNQALAASHNTGRPPDEWEIRDTNGVLLPVEQKIKEFHFSDGVRLFCTLRVGAGGT